MKPASIAFPGRCSTRAPCASCCPALRAEAPIDAEVSDESVYFLTEKGQYKFPIVPPPLRDHGNYVISINKFVKWLAAKVEEAGITIFTGFAGSELLFDPDQSGVDQGGVNGVRTDDKGVDKQGNPKANFEPGYDLHSKITILAEGARGSCTKQLIERFHLEDPEHAQTYGVGIKELWEIPAGRVAKGEVIYTLGYPLTMARVWGRLDLWHLRHSSLGRLRGRPGLSGSAARPTPRLSIVQRTSAGAALAGGRQDDTLWRQNACLTAAGSPCRNWPARAG